MSIKLINPSSLSDEGKNYDKIMEEVGDITYIGEAEIGSSKAEAVWRIRKLNESTGINQGWAESNEDFTHIWDNRTTFTYSQ